MPSKKSKKETLNDQSSDSNSKMKPQVQKELKITLNPDVKEKLIVLKEICREVALHLKKGRVECVYQSAVCQELQMKGISYTSEETIPILYKGKYVGMERIDVALNSYLDFIYEFKAVASDIKPEHIWQLVSYLNHKGYSYGAVVNFNQSVNKGLEIQFIVKKDSVWYLWDLEKEEGEVLMEYTL